MHYYRSTCLTGGEHRRESAMQQTQVSNLPRMRTRCQTAGTANLSSRLTNQQPAHLPTATMRISLNRRLDQVFTMTLRLSTMTCTLNFYYSFIFVY